MPLFERAGTGRHEKMYKIWKSPNRKPQNPQGQAGPPWSPLIFSFSPLRKALHLFASSRAYTDATKHVVVLYWAIPYVVIQGFSNLGVSPKQRLFFS